MFRSTLAAVGLLAVAAPAFAQSILPPDLALVPGDAVGFLHVKVADVWKTEVMKDARAVIEKAGPQALAALDEQFHPAPSTIERVTLIVLSAEDVDPPLGQALVVAFNKPFDAAKVRANHMPKGIEKQVNGKTYYVDEFYGTSITFVDDRTLVLSDRWRLQSLLKATGKADGVLKPAIDAAVKQQFTAAVNVAKMPLDFAQNVPLDVRPALKADRIVLNLALASETTVTMNFGYKTAADAAAGEKAIRKAAEMGRQVFSQSRPEAEALLLGKGRKRGEPRPLDDVLEAAMGLVSLGGLNTLDELLAALPLKTDGDTVTLKVTLPVWMSQYLGMSLAGVGLMMPAAQKVRNAAAQMASSNNLKQIGSAMHNYHDAMGRLPSAAVVDRKGKRLLSWRVAILPYIDQGDLYKQFKLDEPWNSEHNKKLIAYMPKTYADPRDENPRTGQTYYKVFVGESAGFDWADGKKIPGSFPDGTSNTVIVVAAGESVTWTQPDDFEFAPMDPKSRLPRLRGPFRELLALFMDGSVRTINTEMKDYDRIMRLLICPNDGEVIPKLDK